MNLEELAARVKIIEDHLFGEPARAETLKEMEEPSTEQNVPTEEDVTEAVDPNAAPFTVHSVEPVGPSSPDHSSSSE